MKKIWILLSIAVVAASLSSCGKFLDEMPDNRTQIDNLDKARALLVTAYPNRFYASFLESRCDGVIDHGATLHGTQPGSSLSFAYTGFRWDEYPSIESSDDSQSYWMACYSAIGAANHALEAIEQMGNPKGSESAVAEAKLCRAYAHFCLLTLFSNFFDEAKRDVNMGIPYVTETETVINKHYERGTVASTLEKIKADLADGMAHVGTAAEYVQPKFHFTINSARMLALRIALFERDYASVISIASQLIPQPTTFAIINSGGKPLLNADGTRVVIPHPNDLAFIFCGNNLFDWRYTTANISGSDATELAFTNAKNSNIVLAAEPYSVLKRVAASTYYMRYTHSNKDFAAITGSNASGVNWRLPSYGFNSAPASAPSFIPKVHEDFKVTNINANTGQPHARVALFRLEEAILARAEAFAMTGEYDKALHDLTMYAQNRTGSNNPAAYYFSRDKVVSYYGEVLQMSDNYLANTFNAGRFSTNAGGYEGMLQRGLVMAVLDARRTEYLYEGMRWFDILRWNIPVTHRMISGESSTLTPDDDRRVLQIPQTTELSGLEKNPYEHVNSWN